MEWDYRQELEQLRQANVAASPGVRLRAIKQRLGRADDMGAMRLVAAVCAVEALARSLVVHAAGRPLSTADMRYRQVRDTGPVELVDEVLRRCGAPNGGAHFGTDTWAMFELAHQYRDLAVHECTYLTSDKYAALVQAADAVLEGLVEISGLPRLVA